MKYTDEARMDWLEHNVVEVFKVLPVGSKLLGVAGLEYQRRFIASMDRGEPMPSNNLRAIMDAEMAKDEAS